MRAPAFYCILRLQTKNKFEIHSVELFVIEDVRLQKKKIHEIVLIRYQTGFVVIGYLRPQTKTRL